MAAYTDAQREALVLLMEECGEVIQAAAKCLRHGEDARNPFGERPFNNRDELNKELGHVTLAIQLAIEQGVADSADIFEQRKYKRKRIERWLHHFKPSETVR